MRSFPDSGGKWQVSTNGGGQPAWRRDGRELYYLSVARKLMAVEVSGSGSTFVAGAPRELRIPPIGLTGGPRNFFAASKDGQRFLVNAVVDNPGASQMTVVLNWTAELKPGYPQSR